MELLLAFVLQQKLPSDLLDNVRRRTKDLHAYYLGFLAPDERTRLGGLLKSGEGTREDEDFLRNRITAEFLTEVEAEAKALAEQCQNLEAAALQSAKTDVVHLKDGGKKEGSIVEETDEYVRLEIKIGKNTASVKYAKSDVVKIERGKGAGADLADRLQKAGTDVQALAELYKHCKDKNLRPQADYVAAKILTIDPDHALARQHFGSAKDSNGRWRREDTIEAEAGKFKFQGQWYTPEDLEKKLASSGYVKRDGLWHTKKTWSYTLDNLYKDLSKLDHEFKNGGLLDMIDSTSDVVYDIKKKEWVKRDKKVILGRFFGPNGSQPNGPGTYDHREGTVRIRIAAPGAIVRCRVKAPGQITQEGARMVVRANGEVLYRITGKGANEETIELGADALQGDSVTLEAEMYSAWTKGSSGDAMFLPSTREDRYTFQVFCDILLPADSVNKLFAATLSDPDRKTQTAVRDFATQILKTQPTLGKCMAEMAAKTRGLTFQAAPAAPAEYQEILGLLGKDPRIVDVDKLDTASTAAWWRKRTQAEKVAFLEHFGLRCAATR